jgi:hypothetical protein
MLKPNIYSSKPLHPLDKGQTQQLHSVTKHIPDVDVQEQPSPSLFLGRSSYLDSLPCGSYQMTHLETPRDQCRRFTLGVCGSDGIGVCGEVVDDVVDLLLVEDRKVDLVY